MTSALSLPFYPYLFPPSAPNIHLLYYYPLHLFVSLPAPFLQPKHILIQLRSTFLILFTHFYPSQCSHIAPSRPVTFSIPFYAVCLLAHSFQPQHSLVTFSSLVSCSLSSFHPLPFLLVFPLSTSCSFTPLPPPLLPPPASYPFPFCLTTPLSSLLFCSLSSLHAFLSLSVLLLSTACLQSQLLSQNVLLYPSVQSCFSSLSPTMFLLASS